MSYPNLNRLNKCSRHSASRGGLLLAAIVFCWLPASAADQQPPLRRWTDSTGKYTVQARLIDHDENIVRLETEDGRRLKIALQRLSAEDQAYLKQAAPPPPAAPAPSAAPAKAVKATYLDPAQTRLQLGTWRNALAAFRTGDEAKGFQHVEQQFALFRRHAPVLNDGLVLLNVAYTDITRPAENTDQGWQDLLAKLERWQKAHPLSVTPLIAQAWAHIRYGWYARGGGFADTVTEEGWRLFHQRIAVARQFLEQAEKLDAGDPEVYVALLLVGRAEGMPRREMEALVEKASSLHYPYHPAYESLAISLLPRWHGEPGDVEAFATAVAEKLGGDEGLDVYGRIVCEVNRYDLRTIWFGDYSKDKLQQAANLLRARYPTSTEYRDFAALVAFVADDVETARQLAEKIGENPDLNIWGTPANYTTFQCWCNPARSAGQEKATWRVDAPSAVYGLAYSPDGKLLATVDSRPSLSLWEADTGRLVGRLPLLPYANRRVAFDPTGQRIVCAGGGTGRPGEMVIWHLKDGSAEPILIRHNDGLQTIAFSRDGRLITAADGKTVLIWDADTGQQVQMVELPNQHSPIRFGFSKDGKTLVVAGREKMWQMDVISGKLTEVATHGFMDNGQPVTYGRFVTVQDDDWVVVTVQRPGQQTWDLTAWNLTTGQHRYIATGLPSRGGGFSPCGRWRITFDSDRVTGFPRIFVWDIPAQRRVAVFQGHWLSVTGTAVSPDGTTLATSSLDGTVKLWDLAKAAASPPTDEAAENGREP